MDAGPMNHGCTGPKQTRLTFGTRILKNLKVPSVEFHVLSVQIPMTARRTGCIAVAKLQTHLLAAVLPRSPFLPHFFFLRPLQQQ